MRTFLFVMLCAVGATWAAEPKAKACPAKRAEVKAGTGCTPTTPDYCEYPGGKWCACEASRCVSAAGPIPDCQSVMTWVCRDDGCPHPGVRTCSTEGKQCGYDDGLCSSSMVCSQGKWVSQRQQCRPAAPPHP